MKENQTILYAVFEALAKGETLKNAVEKAYNKYGRPYEFPLIGWSLSGTKNHDDMLKIKVQKGNGYHIMGMSRTQYNILRAEKQANAMLGRN